MIRFSKTVSELEDVFVELLEGDGSVSLGEHALGPALNPLG